MSARRRVAGLGCALVALAVQPVVWAQPVERDEAAPPSEAAEPSAEAAAPAPLLLAPGQVHTLTAIAVERVAIGDPDVADVTIVSPTQLLIQAKAAGSTNLLVWDVKGEHQFTIRVVDPKPETVSRELRHLVEQLNMPSVEVKLQGDKVFLMGEVSTEAQQQALEQLATSFAGTVVNLVTVKEVLPPPEGPAPLVRLAVQVIEINRTDLEKLGINWSQSLALTQPLKSDTTVGEALMRFGTGIERSSLSATINALVQQNRARILSEPKLVTASGKQASSFIGVEVPVIQATSIGTSGQSSVNASITFRETGVLLKITPSVLAEDPERRITSVIEAEVSDVDTSVGLSVPVGTQTIVVPGFKVRKANTEVTTVSGESIVIAGLLKTEDSNVASQVPGLGGLPVVGRLFRSPELKSTQTELVITVTPERIGDLQDGLEREMALDQALAVAEVTASVEDPRLRYALQIQDRIAKALRYPQREKELDIDGTVKVKLHLFADGTLGRAMVTESSGVEALDLEALKATESQAPYPGFPRELAERDLWLEVPVIFRP